MNLNAGQNLPHERLPPSPWVVKFAEQIPQGGSVLDVACGSGRHSRFLVARGHRVDAVDQDDAAFSDIPAGVNFVCADIEFGPWPFAGKCYDGVIVTNYLYRPLLPLLMESVAPDGLLIYETFAVGNERYGRPSRPDFLLRPNELVDLVMAASADFDVLAFEEKFIESPKPAVVQRIAARVTG